MIARNVGAVRAGELLEVSVKYEADRQGNPVHDDDLVVRSRAHRSPDRISVRGRVQAAL